jgi:hypothetical protein
MSEWLRRLIRNQLGFARQSSNLCDVVIFNLLFRCIPETNTSCEGGGGAFVVAGAKTRNHDGG